VNKKKVLLLGSYSEIHNTLLMHHDSVFPMNTLAPSREKFATQVNAELLADLRSLAHAEGRQLQVLVEEALYDLLEKRRQTRPRDHVMQAYQASHEKFAPLYKKLAE
jgi:hypothetical protein